MAEEFLKGNFKVKNPVKLSEATGEESVQERLRKRALASLGGSMVYMERNNLTWDGEQTHAGDNSQQI